MFYANYELLKQKLDAVIQFPGMPLHCCCRHCNAANPPVTAKAKKGDEVDASLSSTALPESFERESSKFWLQRQQVVGFIDLVSKRLGPYKFKEQKDVYNIITSLYLDNDAFDLYASRVARRDGAQLVRIRW